MEVPVSHRASTMGARRFALAAAGSLASCERRGGRRAAVGCTTNRLGSAEKASCLLADLGDDGAAFRGGTELLFAMKLGLAT
jgi:hypothetical protein